MTTDEELLLAAGQLNEWLRNDKFAQQAVMKVLSTRGYASLGEMARTDPAAFVELYEAIETMREELPWT